MGKLENLPPDYDIGEFALFLVELICALTPGQRYALISAERGSPASPVRRPHARSISALQRLSLLEQGHSEGRDEADVPRPTYVGKIVASALMGTSAATPSVLVFHRGRCQTRGNSRHETPGLPWRQLQSDVHAKPTVPTTLTVDMNKHAPAGLAERAGAVGPSSAQ
jgi:hypothetical protein